MKLPKFLRRGEAPGLLAIFAAAVKGNEPAVEEMNAARSRDRQRRERESAIRVEEERQRQRRTASAAEIEASCRKLGWWWPSESDGSDKWSRWR